MRSPSISAAPSCSGAFLKLGHFAAGRDDRHDVRLHAVFARGKDAGDEVELFLTHPDHLQEPPQLGLEDDNQGDGAHRDQLSENGREQLHVQRPHDHPQQVDGDDPRKDVGGVGSLGHAVDPVHDRGDQDDVHEVDECERNESHCFEKLIRCQFSCKCMKKTASPLSWKPLFCLLSGRFTSSRPFCRRRTAH